MVKILIVTELINDATVKLLLQRSKGFQKTKVDVSPEWTWRCLSPL